MSHPRHACPHVRDNVDDGPAAAVHALGENFPGHQEAPGQVGAHYGFPAFLADQGQRGGELAAGIVDQTMNGLYGVVDCRYGGFDGLLVADVTGKAQCLATVFVDFGDHAVQFFLFAADQHHTCSQ